MLIFPVGIVGSGEKVYAAPAEIDFGSSRKISLSILNDTGTELADDATVTTNIEEPGQVAYISNTIRIKTNKIAKYYVGVQAADGSSNLLTGTTYTEETISGVGDNVSPNEFGDNTWGYNLTSNTTATNSSLTYSTLPAYNTNTAFQYTSDTNPADGNHDLKLTFAAKINANKPADHYTTKAMVSVAADPKEMPKQATLGNITKMSEMTSAYCKSLPNVTASSQPLDVPTGQLIDDRADAGGQKYWVSKLADGNCWMTQNLDYGAELVDSTWNAMLIYDPGLRVYNGANTMSNLVDVSNSDSYILSSNASMEEAIRSDAVSGKQYYNGHALIGNYYSWGKAQEVCPSGWTVPVGGQVNSTSSTMGSFGRLLGDASIANSEPARIEALPYYFLKGGNFNNTSRELSGLAESGSYWTKTAGDINTAAYSLFFDGSQIDPMGGGHKGYFNYSVRCVVLSQS